MTAPVTDDWFVAAVEQVAAAGRAAGEALNAATEALKGGLHARLTGKSMIEVVDELIGGGGREIRFASAEAFRDFERAVAAMRAGVARSLVDDHGLSLTEVARRLNISRQSASRLYQSACAQAFGLQTIAEGVEDEATLQLLRDEGVDYAQGFHLGRPVPLDGSRQKLQ